MKLTNNQWGVLRGLAERPDTGWSGRAGWYWASPYITKLACTALVKKGLVERFTGRAGLFAWRITDAGRAALGHSAESTAEKVERDKPQRGEGA